MRRVSLSTRPAKVHRGSSIDWEPCGQGPGGWPVSWCGRGYNLHLAAAGTLEPGKQPRGIVARGGGRPLCGAFSFQLHLYWLSWTHSLASWSCPRAQRRWADFALTYFRALVTFPLVSEQSSLHVAFLSNCIGSPAREGGSWACAPVAADVVSYLDAASPAGPAPGECPCALRVSHCLRTFAFYDTVQAGEGS